MKPASPERRGRKARTAQRSAPIAREARPVWPGVEGGRYHPLNDADVQQVHTTVLDLLERVGLSAAIPSMVERVCAAGGSITDDGRLLFPRALVEDVIDSCRKEFVLYGQVPGRELELSGARVHAGTGGASPNFIDLESGLYREATTRDLFDVARLVDQLEHIHFFNRSLVARDCPEPREFDINTAYASMMGTTKHLGLSFFDPLHVRDVAEMFDIVAGGPGKFREKPFCTLLSCHVVPPMRFAQESCAALEEGVRLGFPVQLISAGQAGATSPSTLAGSVVQAVAESLAGLVFVYLVDPEVKAIFAPKPLVSDLRTGAMSGGSGEQGVLMAAAGQMGKFYGLMTSSMAGMTDAKTPDTQHGYEKCHGLTLAANAGVNVLTQASGLQASLLGCSFESYVIDNDMLGSILRGVRGIEVSADSLAAGVIEDVVYGEGHYLGHEQTLARMESDYVYPDVADRQSPSDWQDAGSLDIRERAKLRAREILDSHFPSHVDEATDRRIRERFNIVLPREVMRSPQ
ncbi:MAG: trimethylamine methyltransferase family protein [Pseudomonadota bacterium]